MTTNANQEFNARVLVPGRGQGQALVLPEPLSLWGGLDPETGEIIDQRHPRAGAIVSRRVLILPSGRGSSSASSILLEAVRVGTAPAAIITAEPDAILALGAAVAREMYGDAPPVVVLNQANYRQLQDGQRLRVTEAGIVTVVRRG
jgi:predicted aconitase with swiveling domain